MIATANNLPKPESSAPLGRIDELQIKSKLSKGHSIRDVLREDFPNARIQIVRGVDTFHHVSGHYTEEALLVVDYSPDRDTRPAPRVGYFSMDMSGIYTIAATVAQLENGTAFDDAAEKLLDTFDRDQVYEHLERSILEERPYP